MIYVNNIKQLNKEIDSFQEIFNDIGLFVFDDRYELVITKANVSSFKQRNWAAPTSIFNYNDFSFLSNKEFKIDEYSYKFSCSYPSSYVILLYIEILDENWTDYIIENKTITFNKD